MTMFLLAASTTKVSISAKDVVEHGAGPVKRSIVVHIMTRQQDNAWQPRILMINVVVRKLDSIKKITVLEVTARIVRSDGEPFVESNLR